MNSRPAWEIQSDTVSQEYLCLNIPTQKLEFMKKHYKLTAASCK